MALVILTNHDRSLPNQIGTSVAVEALRDAWRSRKVTVDDLWHHAKICRVSNVIRPYLEAIVQ